MDWTVEFESGRRLDSVLAEGDVRLSKESPLAKRIEGWGLIGNVKKLAETVLVLAAMGKMRVGRGPTELENTLITDALCRMAKVRECFAPKDMFPQDAFGDGKIRGFLCILLRIHLDTHN
ncbi:uncharacterized protein LOC111402467 [Olea europaea var. sylvestris]|uniref:uncharacterized protein LOC111402467 n=1 Tax=Olea europaea var. sylvestris TaxID=158386 RepID=UPI000C1CFC5B|nr:uncharacterized protein LOC111402467 [Olea europaea var. sylvestris]